MLHNGESIFDLAEVIGHLALRGVPQHFPFVPSKYCCSAKTYRPFIHSILRTLTRQLHSWTPLPRACSFQQTHNELREKNSNLTQCHKNANKRRLFISIVSKCTQANNFTKELLYAKKRLLVTKH